MRILLADVATMRIIEVRRVAQPRHIEVDDVVEILGAELPGRQVRVCGVFSTLHDEIDDVVFLKISTRIS